MILEIFSVTFVAIILTICLCKMYIKTKTLENLIILSLSSLSVGIYIPFAIYELYIPILVQILVIIFVFIIPTISVTFQYNNSILRRRLLYYKMKKTYNYKDYKTTMKYVEKLIDTQGISPEFTCILAQCNRQLGDNMRARELLEQTLEQDLDYYLAYYELGQIYEESNDRKSAMEMFYKAIEIKPDFYEANEALGICYTKQGKFAKAVEIYREALKENPTSHEFYYNIGMLELELRNQEVAETAFENACNLKENLYISHYNVAELSYLRGDYEKSIEHYKKTLGSKLYGNKAYYKLSRVYEAVGEFEKAMSTLEYAVELDPKYVQRALEDFSTPEMRELIRKYLIARDELMLEGRRKQNYMREKWPFFKQKKKYISLDLDEDQILDDEEVQRYKELEEFSAKNILG